MNWLNRYRWLSLGLVSLVCTLIGIGFYAIGLVFILEGEFAFMDYRIRFGHRSPVDPRIVFIAIDAKSTTVGGAGGLFDPEEIKQSPGLTHMAEGWPFNRSVWADVVEKLVPAGAKVVAFDLLFPTPREDSPQGDAAFRAVLKKYARQVVIGSNFSTMEDLLPDGTAREQVVHTTPTEALLGLAEANDPRVAYVNFWSDPDGRIRQARYTLKSEQLSGDAFGPDSPLYFSLAARSLAHAGFGDRVPQRLESVFFRYAGPAQTFHPIPLYEIFYDKTWKDHFQNGAFFKDKIVLVGPYGNWSKDELATPFGTMPGPEIHLNALNAALNQDFLREAPLWTDYLLISLAGLCAWGLGLLVRLPILRLILLAGFSGAYFFLLLTLYNEYGLFLMAFTPLLVFNSSGITGLIGEFVAERLEKARIRGTLERYVSKNVVKEILDNPRSYLTALGGVRRNVTILFSDIRGFTSMTESADSSQLVLQLNEYFEEMVRHVFEHQGTLDKFIGDAVMAVWGNIQSLGTARDTEEAILCALDMRASLAQLNKGWPAKKFPELSFGIGINHGEAIVGELGSSEKKEITVIGDAVNLCSRLESLTKEYHLDLLVGESAADLVQDKFHFQEVDYVTVKGKTKPVKVYAVHGPASDPIPPELERYLDEFQKGASLYHTRDFEKARNHFRNCRGLRPSDFLGEIYLQRCEEYLQTPPPSDWNGAYVMIKK
jgi:adenylate cyclase